MRNKSKYISGLLAMLLLLAVQPVWAAGPPAPSLFSNPLALTFIILMVLLLIIIGILGNILLGAADVKLKKRKKGASSQALGSVAALFLLLSSQVVLAQATTPDATATATTTIGGMSASTFYVMATVLFLELFIIIALLINIKFLLKAEKERIVTEVTPEAAIVTAEEKLNKLSWWDRFNKLRPVSEEAELDLGHEYDGIRELNNRLPPWWLYGFYLCIIFAVVYLWRFHVSHEGPSSRQEFERSIAKAELQVQEYLKKKGESVDENTVTLLTSPEDLAAGKAIFTNPARCITCHGPEGGGNAVGPNLTDDYWIYGGNIKTIFKTIKYGANNGMKSWKDELSAKQIAQVASFIKSLKGTKPANPKDPQGELYIEETAPAAPVDSATTEPKKIAMNQ